MEIQDLIKQVDATLNAQSNEWQNKFKLVNNKLSLKEQEFLAQKITVKQKNEEIAQLQKNVDNFERTQQKLTSYYHGQLMSLKDEIAIMKNEHAKLLTKYNAPNVPVQVESSNPDGEVKKWLATVESCNSKISQLELEKNFLQQQLQQQTQSEQLKENVNVKISKEFRRFKQACQSKNNSVKEQRSNDSRDYEDNLERSSSQTKELNKQQENANSKNTDVLLLGELKSPLDEIGKLKYYVNQLQTVVRQKDQHILTRMEQEELMKEKIKSLQESLFRSNRECKKLVEKVGSAKKTTDELIKWQKEVAEKDATICKLEKELEEIEEMKCQLEQNETNTKIELQVATAQLNALKMENTNLRRIYISDMSPNNSDSMKYFQELQQAYYDSLRTLETQNRHLEVTISTLQTDQNHIRSNGDNAFSLQMMEVPPVSIENSVRSNRTRSSTSHSAAKNTNLEAIDHSPGRQHTKRTHKNQHKPTFSSSNNNNNNSAIFPFIDFTSRKEFQISNDIMDDKDDLDEVSVSSLSSGPGSLISRKDRSL